MAEECACPFYILVQICPRALQFDKQGGGDYNTVFIWTSTEETRPWSSSLWLLVRTPSALGPELAKFGQSMTYSSECHKILWYTIVNILDVCLLILMAYLL